MLRSNRVAQSTAAACAAGLLAIGIGSHAAAQTELPHGPRFVASVRTNISGAACGQGMIALAASLKQRPLKADDDFFFGAGTRRGNGEDITTLLYCGIEGELIMVVAVHDDRFPFEKMSHLRYWKIDADYSRTGCERKAAALADKLNAPLVAERIRGTQQNLTDSSDKATVLHDYLNNRSAIVICRPKGQLVTVAAQKNTEAWMNEIKAAWAAI